MAIATVTPTPPPVLSDTVALSHQPPKLMDRVRDRIRTLHYSYRTEQAYTHWIKRYILHHGKRHPQDMGADEIEAFLSHLATAHGQALGLRSAHPAWRLARRDQGRRCALPPSLSDPPHLRQHDAHRRRVTGLGGTADGAQRLGDDRADLWQVGAGRGARCGGESGGDVRWECWQIPWHYPRKMTASHGREQQLTY